MPLAQLLDQDDALLQLRPPLVELLDLLHEGPETNGLLLRAGNPGIELLGLAQRAQ